MSTSKEKGVLTRSGALELGLENLAGMIVMFERMYDNRAKIYSNGRPIGTVPFSPTHIVPSPTSAYGKMPLNQTAIWGLRSRMETRRELGKRAASGGPQVAPDEMGQYLADTCTEALFLLELLLSFMDPGKEPPVSPEMLPDPTEWDYAEFKPDEDVERS